ncbi:MAG TPA: hypothetical protein VFR19_20150, partial [Hyphomicrobiaceae bacterium]|nr:hypothetical protein [Hyphomicrobiaceae bacterium]
MIDPNRRQTGQHLKTEMQAVAMLGAVAKGALAKWALAIGVLLAVCAGPALAQELRTYGKKGSYEDV